MEVAYNTCIFMVSKIDVKGVDVILGNVFMRKYVSLFSYSNRTIGIFFFCGVCICINFIFI
jgi:hypothetical protein